MAITEVLPSSREIPSRVRGPSEMLRESLKNFLAMTPMASAFHKNSETRSDHLMIRALPCLETNKQNRLETRAGRAHPLQDNGLDRLLL